MSTDLGTSPVPLAQHSFACARCNNEAGLVKLFARDQAGEIIRDSSTSKLTCSVEAKNLEQVRDIVLAGDIQALHEFSLEVACFYCPLCRACYCGAHWVRWDVFDDDDGFVSHDSIRGRCPLGHERMLED